jgi:transmembrane sensor
MIGARTSEGDARRASAADWFVRLAAPDLGEDELAAFDGWLADPANAYVYDETLAVALELEAAAPAMAAALKSRRPGRALAGRRVWLAAGTVAAAAAVVLAVAPGGPSAPERSYVTARGAQRSMTLADGSTIDLNAGSALKVSLGPHERRVELERGEAVFDVAHDPGRPFVIAAGDRRVRVVGTRFDVRRREGRLSVSVERGLVQVEPLGGGHAYRLRPGQRLDHQEGAAGVAVTAVDPAQIESWKTGRLIYRDRPLAEVVADLNQQFATPIRIEDPALGETPVSGVLVLDDQAAVIRRLALLAPIKALTSPQGVLLRRDGAPKP